MKPWHKERGLTEKGAHLAERALPIAQRLVAMCGDAGLARAVLAEACFRYCDLPYRAAEFQARYLKDNE